MASPYTQDQRIGRLEIRELDDQLALLSISGTEGLSQLFEYRVEAISLEKKILNFDKAIAEHCTVFLQTVDGGERVFDGMLAEARWIGTRVEGHAYELILRPWLWLLSKRINSKIFHDKTAPEIIRLIFNEHGGLANFQPSLTKGYPKLEYCAQYRESDMDFVCRLMEEHGISYHFRHSASNHKLVMGDGLSAYQAVAGASRPFISIAEQHNRDKEHLSLWRPERKYVTGKVAMVDYDFKKPSANMKAEKSGDSKFEQGKFESYVHPGRYVNAAEGLLYAEAQLDMRRGEDCHFHAEGDCASSVPWSAGQSDGTSRRRSEPAIPRAEGYAPLRRPVLPFRYRRRASLSGRLRIHPVRSAFRPAHDDTKALYTRAADGQGGGRRRDRLRQIRPHPGAISLGQEKRSLALGACRAGCRRTILGRDIHAPCRDGGDRRLSGG